MSDRSGVEAVGSGRSSLLVPRPVSDAALRCLDHIGRALVTLHVPASAVSLGGLVLAALAGLAVGTGHFGLAAAAMILASLGDALDGLVARRSHSASVSGALLDASVDRYEEFFFLGGLAFLFRGKAPLLVLTLLALCGSFMISYGSAKAEAIGVPAPPSAMRRAERAVCLCVGTAATCLAEWGVARLALPAWIGIAPVVAALAVVAVVANVSAIRRLRAIARQTDVAAPSPSTAPFSQAGAESAPSASPSSSARRPSRLRPLAEQGGRE